MDFNAQLEAWKHITDREIHIMGDFNMNLNLGNKGRDMGKNLVALTKVACLKQPMNSSTRVILDKKSILDLYFSV